MVGKVQAFPTGPAGSIGTGPAIPGPLNPSACQVGRSVSHLMGWMNPCPHTHSKILGWYLKVIVV